MKFIGDTLCSISLTLYNHASFSPVYIYIYRYQLQIAQLGKGITRRRKKDVYLRFNLYLTVSRLGRAPLLFFLSLFLFVSSKLIRVSPLLLFFLAFVLLPRMLRNEGMVEMEDRKGVKSMEEKSKERKRRILRIEVSSHSILDFSTSIQLFSFTFSLEGNSAFRTVNLTDD